MQEQNKTFFKTFNPRVDGDTSFKIFEICLKYTLIYSENFKTKIRVVFCKLLFFTFFQKSDSAIFSKFQYNLHVHTLNIPNLYRKKKW